MATSKQTALITGATSGIGLELARCFAEDGHNLVLVARTEKRLAEVAEQLAGDYDVETRVVVADLAKHEAPQQIFDSLDDSPIDFLVNNAGFGLGGRFQDTELSEELDMIQVNMTALISLTKLFLQGMVKRGRGRIMNVASTASFQPGPNMSIYCATKAFVLSFSEAIAHELRGSGVTVTALCPGGTATGFQARASIEKAALVSSGLLPVMTPEAVAKEGYGAFMKGKTVVVTGFVNRLGVHSIRVTPRSIAAAIAGRLMET